MKRSLLCLTLLLAIFAFSMEVDAKIIECHYETYFKDTQNINEFLLNFKVTIDDISGYKSMSYSHVRTPANPNAQESLVTINLPGDMKRELENTLKKTLPQNNGKYSCPSDSLATLSIFDSSGDIVKIGNYHILPNEYVSGNCGDFCWRILFKKATGENGSELDAGDGVVENKPCAEAVISTTKNVFHVSLTKKGEKSYTLKVSDLIINNESFEIDDSNAQYINTAGDENITFSHKNTTYVFEPFSSCEEFATYKACESIAYPGTYFINGTCDSDGTSMPGSSQSMDNFEDWLKEFQFSDGGHLTCEELLGTTLTTFLKVVFMFIQWAAPVILIVTGMMDFTKATASSNADALQKATRTFAKRAVVCALLVILPALIHFIASIAGITDLSCITGL